MVVAPHDVVPRFSMIKWLADEWHGEGKLFGKGVFSEFGWAIVTGDIGLSMARVPESVTNVRILSVIIKNTGFGPELFAPILMTCAILTLVGLGLFYVRGKCIASRIFRLLGASLGMAIWFTILFSAIDAFRGETAFLSLYAFGALSFARAISLGWRRF